MTESRKSGPATDELKPTTIMGQVYGVFPAFAMLAAMRLDVFTPLRDGPLAAGAVAEALGVRADKLAPLLYSLVEVGLLKVENGRFSNTGEAGKYLVRGRPDYMGELCGFYQTLWELALKTADSIRAGKPQAKLDFHNLPEEELLAYFRKQFHHSLRAGREIAAKIDFSKTEKLLDAGGGTGGVSIAVCEKNPGLTATVADLPKVAKLAEQFISEAGLSGRIDISTNDLRCDPPAEKYDAAIMRALIQTLSEEDARLCLKCVGRSLLPGGRLFIFGNVMDNSNLGPPPSLAFSLVFLNSYDQGRAYTENEYRDMLQEAGFTDVAVEYEALDDGLCLIRAIKNSEDSTDGPKPGR